MIRIKVPCKYNNQGAWCTNPLVGRSLYGLGARCCTQYPHRDGTCKHQDLGKRPPPPPPPPPKRIIREDITLDCPLAKKDK